MTASRTTPTLCVLVIITGPSRKPDSSTHVVPVISPLPLSDHQPAKTGLFMESLPRGRTAVTPVRTGPLPTWSLPSPEMSVVWPTVTPQTSVMALSGPGVPAKGKPKTRARGWQRGSGEPPQKKLRRASKKEWRERVNNLDELLFVLLPIRLRGSQQFGVFLHGLFQQSSLLRRQ